MSCAVFGAIVTKTSPQIADLLGAVWWKSVDRGRDSWGIEHFSVVAEAHDVED